MELVGEHSDPDTPSRRHLLHVLAGRSVTDLDATVFDALATLDGAVVTEPNGQLLAVGAILRHPHRRRAATEEGVTEGARTTAAMAASRYGPVLKVSEDGMITFYRRRPHLGHLIRRSSRLTLGNGPAFCVFCGYFWNVLRMSPGIGLSVKRSDTVDYNDRLTDR